MLLTIDVGNTNTELDLFEGHDLHHSFRLMSKRGCTADELGLSMTGFLRQFQVDPETISGVIIGSVVPELMTSLTGAVSKYLGQEPVVVKQDVCPTLEYLSPSAAWNHGADRGVACTAAVEKYGAPLIVLDCGTATTLDAVNRSGVYVGGSICTGLQVSMEALADRASLLPRVELALPEQFLGYDTVSQIQTGVVGCYVGGMEYLLRHTKAEMEEPDEEIRVIATGGLSPLIASHTSCIDVVDRSLVPYGLVLLWEKYLREHT